MVCISTECPYYAKCRRALVNMESPNQLHTVARLASYGSGMAISHMMETTYVCGPRGNYAMYQPKLKQVKAGLY